MESSQHEINSNEALIINELERRYYLFLVGGDYEKLFYSFEPQDDNQEPEHNRLNISRIRLEIEVTQAERQAQRACKNGHPEYKKMLDFMLKHRINSKLESDEFLYSCREFSDLQPFWKELGGRSDFTADDFKRVEETPWLAKQILAFCQQQDFKNVFKIVPSMNLQDKLEALGYPLFIWMLPRWAGEVLYARLHPSLKPVLARLTSFGRKTSAAIATLALSEHYDKKEKWVLYSLAAINVIPLVMLISLVNEEIQTLMTQQSNALGKDPVNQKKLEVVNQFEFSGDDLRDILSMEQIIKPYILEHLDFKHFDPQPYLLGYSESDTHISSLFFQARAFAFYKQLFKTGRIHPRETAIFLKRHKINNAMLQELNKMDLSSLSNHVALHHRFLNS